MSHPTPNPSALTSRSSPTSSRPDRKPLLPSPIARSARAAAAGAQGLQSPQVNRSIPTVELGGSKSLFGSFRSLGPNTRIVFGLVLGAVGLAGLMVDRNVLQDDKGEEKAGISVRMVDRKV